jgi:hypothetical protein
MTGVTAVVVACASVGLYLFGELIFDGLVYELGTMSFSLLAFVLPPVFYLAEQGFGNVKWGCLAVFVLIGGVTLMAIGTTLTVISVVGTYRE